jgi:hypothetical protein
MDFLFDNLTNTTTVAPFTTTTIAPNSVPTYVGYIGVLISVVFLGSNFLPIKKFETGDGMFFQ